MEISLKMLLSLYFFRGYIYNDIDNVSPLASHDVGVGDGVGDCDVSVHADDDEVEDGGGAGPHVHTQPDEAEVPAKYPSVHHLVDCGERQDQDAQQQVRHCQGHNEGVGGTGQLGGDLDSDDHQDVSEGDHETYEAERHERAYNLRHIFCSSGR